MSDTEGYEETQPEHLPDSDATGLDLSLVWSLTELVRDRQAFSTQCGLQGKNVLDYPGGFRFGDPRGLASGEAGVRWFHAMEPSYVVWALAGDGRIFTIAWYSEKEQAFNFPNLAEPPLEVQRQQWLLRALGMPLPLPAAGAGVSG